MKKRTIIIFVVLVIVAVATIGGVLAGKHGGIPGLSTKAHPAATSLKAAMVSSTSPSSDDVFECGMWRFENCAHVPIDQARCLAEGDHLEVCKDIVMFSEKADGSKAIDCRRPGQTAEDVMGSEGVLSLELFKQEVAEVDLCDCRCVPADTDQSKPYKG